MVVKVDAKPQNFPSWSFAEKNVLKMSEYLLIYEDYIFTISASFTVLQLQNKNTWKYSFWGLESLRSHEASKICFIDLDIKWFGESTKTCKSQEWIDQIQLCKK